MASSVIDISSDPPSPWSGVSEVVDEEITILHRRSARLKGKTPNAARFSSQSPMCASQKGRKGAQRNDEVPEHKTLDADSRKRKKGSNESAPLVLLDIIELTDDDEVPNMPIAGPSSQPETRKDIPLAASPIKSKRGHNTGKQQKRAGYHFRSRRLNDEVDADVLSTPGPSAIKGGQDLLSETPAEEVISAGSKRRRGDEQVAQAGDSDAERERPRTRTRTQLEKGKARAVDMRGTGSAYSTPSKHDLNLNHLSSPPPQARPPRQRPRPRPRLNATMSVDSIPNDIENFAIQASDEDAEADEDRVPAQEQSTPTEPENDETDDVSPPTDKGKGKGKEKVIYPAAGGSSQHTEPPTTTTSADTNADEYIPMITSVVPTADVGFVKSLLACCLQTDKNPEAAMGRVIELLLADQSSYQLRAGLTEMDPSVPFDVDSPALGSSSTMEEILFDAEIERRLEATLADEQLAKKLMEEEAMIPLPDEEEQGFECGCCCVDFPFHEMIQCLEGHLFCKKCVTTHTSTQLLTPPPLRPPPGSSSSALRIVLVTCLNFDPTAPCNAPFHSTELQRALPPSVYEKWEKETQARELDAAGIEGLVECPNCEWRCVIEGLRTDDNGEIDAPVFRCARKEEGGCEMVSCIRCKAPDHRPKTCSQLEQENAAGSGRHTIEEAMTHALMRNCPKCRKPYIKEDGCNKMTCASCHTIWCYICRMPIRGYDHFDSGNEPSSSGATQKCKLWDPKEKVHDEQAGVQSAYKKAVEEYRRSNPNESLDDLKIDIPKTYTPPNPRAQAGMPAGRYPGGNLAQQFALPVLPPLQQPQNLGIGAHPQQIQPLDYNPYQPVAQPARGRRGDRRGRNAPNQPLPPLPPPPPAAMAAPFPPMPHLAMGAPLPPMQPPAMMAPIPQVPQLAQQLPRYRGRRR